MNEIVRFIGRSADPHAIKIGNEAENLAQAIKFELPHEFKYATVFLHIQFGYYADVVNLGDDRIFKPTRTHTQKPGRYTAYLEALIDGDVVWKSDVFYLHVGSLPNDGELIEKKYPTAFEEALQAVAALTDIKLEAETLPPGSNATVRLEKNEVGESILVYGLPRGEQGVSPTVDVKPIDNGHRIIVTDAIGPKTFDVMDGKDGADGGAADVTAESITAALGYTPASKDDVSNVNEGAYELIETITLEEAAAVDRTKEPDGTPYKFKAVLAFIETSGSLAATNLYYHSGSPAVTLSPIVKKDTTTLGRIVLECVQQYGYWIGKWRASWTTSSTTGTNECYLTRINTHTATTAVKDHPYITRCRTSAELPTGTIIYIWGVRADG